MTTSQPPFDTALDRHQAGDLSGAEVLYREALRCEPRHARALHMLGVVEFQRGRRESAAELIRRAIAIAPDSPDAHAHLGLVLAAEGQTTEAITAYRRAIALRPEFADAYNNLANALKQQSELDSAIEAYQMALNIRPGFAQARNNLGFALCDQGNFAQRAGRPGEALAAFEAALAARPNFPEALNNIGLIHNDAGRWEKAVVAYRAAIAQRPDFADAHYNLAISLAAQGDFPEAIIECHRAVAIRPDWPQGWNNLGIYLGKKGRLDESIAAYNSAIAARPDYADAHCNLGAALRQAGRFREAVVSYHSALKIAPTFAQAYCNLGDVLKRRGRLDSAAAAFARAIELKPDLAEAYNNLANARKDQGALDDALHCYDQALRLRPDDSAAASNRLYSLLFHPAFDADALLREHLKWDQQYAQPLAGAIRPHDIDASCGRRLRIGYVSPDFREHVVGHNLLPLLREHDRQRFEIYCYSDVSRPDATTAQFRSYADHWRDARGCKDECLAEMIRNDRIDVLVDLALHMSHNRLTAFARKPAPVQITFAGYPGTTGLAAMDFRLTDPFLDPPGPGDAHYAERSLRLADSFWCYDPPAAAPAVGPPPAMRNGFVTFGCLNNFCKINGPVLKLWARVLRGVDRSRLLILCGKGRHRRRTADVLAAEGVDPGLVDFLDFQPRDRYLGAYQRIDVGLDTLPYNGHTTSLDSLWMGVPVVTLVGRTAVGRAGWCQLSNLNLTEFAAHHPDAFVNLAIDVAGDLPRLAALRLELRDRMSASTLTNAPRFARSVEAAYLDAYPCNIRS